jgi:hypothetical protein
MGNLFAHTLPQNQVQPMNPETKTWMKIAALFAASSITLFFSLLILLSILIA